MKVKLLLESLESLTYDEEEIERLMIEAIEEYNELNSNVQSFSEYTLEQIRKKNLQ